MLKRLALLISLALLPSPVLAQGFLCCFNPVGNIAPSTPPTMGGAGNTVTFTQGGAATVIDSGVTVSGTITSATATIASGFVNGDTLNFTNGALTGNYSPGTGILQITGTGSAATYQSALRSVTFSNANDPTNAGSSFSRTITWTGINVNAANTVSSTVNVVALPIVSNVGTSNVFIQSLGAVVVAPSLTLAAFSASNISSASVAVTATFAAGDQLVFANQLGITGSYNAGTGVLALSGTATVANYQIALSSIQYNFTGANVTNPGGTNLSRTITWAVTDANSNVSTSQSTMLTVSAGSTTKPSWVPSWATDSCNWTVGQCWNGTVVIPSTGFISTTRTANEACPLASSIIFVGANTPCINQFGLASWEARTNLTTFSNDLSNTSGWNTFLSGSGTAAVVGNSVVAPDGTTTAAKVTVGRTTVSAFGDSAFLYNHSAGFATAGSYTESIWLKADGSTDVGKAIELVISDGITNTVNTGLLVTLTANWKNYQLSRSLQQCSGNSCSFILGYYGGFSNTQTGTVNFDAWGAQTEAGGFATPLIVTTGAQVPRDADNIVLIGTFSTLVGGMVGTIEMQTNGLNAIPSTLLDSNGNTFLGATSNQTLTTSLPGVAGPLTTANWAGTNTSDITWDGTGRSMALNHQVFYTDASSPVPIAPFHLGSALAGSVTGNVVNGYIQLASVGSTRVSNSTIGLVPGGTNYYFSAAGSDGNDCKSTITSCSNNFATTAKVNTITYNPDDFINLNKGDRFTGCMLLNGNGGNVQTVSTDPLTVQGYGTGARPIMDSQGVQCPGAYWSPSDFTKAANIHVNAVSGLVWNGVDVHCDATGNQPRGISLENNSAANNSTIIIENVNFTGFCGSKSGNFNTDGGGIMWDVTGTTVAHFNVANSNGGLIGHVTLQNIVCAGTSPTDNFAPDACTKTVGYIGSQIQFDLVQSVLAYNLGGHTNTPGTAPQDAGLSGTGFYWDGMINTLAQTPMQYMVAHDNGANYFHCGDNYGVWSEGATDMLWQFAESYHNRNAGSAANGACDEGGFDFDGGVGNSTLQYSYSHDNSGPFINLQFMPDSNRSGTSWTNNIIRYNISDGDGVSSESPIEFAGGTIAGAAYVYNNTVIQSGANTRLGNSVLASTQANTCPGAGSIFANNLMVFTQSSNVGQVFNLSTLCPLLTFANNGYFCTNCSGGTGTSGQYYWHVAGNFIRGLAAWQTFLANSGQTAPGGDTNAIAGTNPSFAGTIGSNQTCWSQTTPPTSSSFLGAGNCPSAYKLGGGSVYKSPAGADLTSSAFGTLNVGTRDYYGVAIPCGGYPIGASC